MKANWISAGLDRSVIEILHALIYKIIMPLYNGSKNREGYFIKLKKTWSVFSDVVSDQRMMVKVFNKNLARYTEFPQ